jgi:hypothetical protein
VIRLQNKTETVPVDRPILRRPARRDASGHHAKFLGESQDGKFQMPLRGRVPLPLTAWVLQDGIDGIDGNQWYPAAQGTKHASGLKFRHQTGAAQDYVERVNHPQESVPMNYIEPKAKSRRQFLQIAPVLGVCALGVEVAVAQDATLKDSDPEAAAIEYRTDAAQVDPSKYPKYMAGQNCSNCNIFYADSGASTGACGIVFSKLVAASGWCTSYEKKPS